MTTKVVNAIKLLGMLCIIGFAFISCEKEMESVGVGLIDSDLFSTNSQSYEVITTSKNIESVDANNLPQYLLGVYSDNEFGKIEASIATTLALPAIGNSYTYGENVLIDSVLMTIPYQVTKEGDADDGQALFTIDSIIGQTNTAFQIDVFELETFLNNLDPTDPTKRAVYSSNKEFQRGTTPFYTGSFTANKLDTVTFIDRKLADNSTVYDIDTIYEDDKRPAIKLPLNKSLIQQIFVDNAGSADFASYEEFAKFFRGFYIEAKPLTSNESHLISLDMAGARMTIYYSNEQDEEDTEDLNNNGTEGEEKVRVKDEFNFLFGLLKSNVLKRDNSNIFSSGDDRIYVQGAAGFEGLIDLFPNDNLEELRSKNWLITEANLVFNIDASASSDIIPERLILYNTEENKHLLDMIVEGPTALGGFLERDDEGNPKRYIFKITDYVSELLKLDDPEVLTTLGLRVYNPTDEPSDRTDVNVKSFNWNPKGVVLFGHDQSFDENRVKLEITYTELNN